MPILDVPGVYINEVTSPGVIAGVGTSTAAFIGPALNGPINVPTRISSFDDFLQTFGLPQPDGSINPYIVTPRPFYMAFGVRGFYDNGGTQAYVVRVGTAVAAAWDIKNANAETAFRLTASQVGAAGNAITVATQLASITGAGGAALANPTSKVGTVAGLNVTVAAGESVKFRVGDIVTRDANPEPPASRATVTKIDTTTDTLTLSAAIPLLVSGDTLRLASILKTQTTFRLASTTGIFPGTIADLKGKNDVPADASDPVLVLSVDGAGFVTVASAPARANNYNMTTAVGVTPVLVSHEFRVIVNVPGKAAQQFDNLSMSPQHPNYVFFAITSPDFAVHAPAVPPVAPVPQNLIPAVASVPLAVTGADDNPGAVGLTEYQAALDNLKNIQDVNIITIPDAASNPSAVAIQGALVNHCQATTDRFAVVDSQLGAPLSGPGSVAVQVGTIPPKNGYAALYYPWLSVKDPTSSGAVLRTMLVPPSGAMAGVYARTDNERGVHKAPANTDVRGVLGLERVLSDAQQGPLNLLGVDVLRIFPGTSQVTVWGARTVDMAETDWMYVNVRRLMIYIEQSIKEGLRWAVFEPNGLPLWQRVKRTLNEFLTRVWQSGALFGATADKAFYVRIDEGNNPPALRAKGELHIEIGVAPVRPAEFIVVTIGLWDGGAQISES
jgi:phage tail sheath protein FI